MELQDLSLPDFFRSHYRHFHTLTPIQEKALSQGLLAGKSLLLCAPTASGKTLVASMAIAHILHTGGKALYLVPLKALANEKYKEYQRLLQGTPYTAGLAIGDVDSESNYLAKYNLLVLTTEKLDSLLRHRIAWLSAIRLVVIDEIHLLHDPGRGPTLEIIITLLKLLIQPQLLGLSATVGNPTELAAWLGAELVLDSWRPVELKQGIACDNAVEFY